MVLRFLYMVPRSIVILIPIFALATVYDHSLFTLSNIRRKSRKNKKNTYSNAALTSARRAWIPHTSPLICYGNCFNSNPSPNWSWIFFYTNSNSLDYYKPLPGGSKPDITVIDFKNTVEDVTP